jgi:hypothetical protein
LGTKRVGDVAQEVESLPLKFKALSSNPIPPKTSVGIELQTKALVTGLSLNELWAFPF